MHINGKAFRTIWFDEKDQAVKIIDQTKLPHKFEVKNLKTVKDAINAIKTMEVRGAPLIGATAAYGVVLAIMENNDPKFIKKSSEDLIKSRPTAINLKWAVKKMNSELKNVSEKERYLFGIKKAKEICDEDVSFCRKIGEFGKKIITSREKEFISLMVIFGQIRLLQNISSKLNFATNSEIQKLRDKFFQ